MAILPSDEPIYNVFTRIRLTPRIFYLPICNHFTGIEIILPYTIIKYKGNIVRIQEYVIESSIYKALVLETL